MDYKMEYNKLRLENIKLKKRLLDLELREHRAARAGLEVRCFNLNGELSKAN